MDKPIPFIVKDGDTFSHGGTEYRMAGYDAPEIAHPARDDKLATEGQPYSLESANKLAELLARGDVKITPQGAPDAHGRVIANVTAGDVNVNEEMVRAGAGWSYDRYNDESAIKTLAAEARNAKRGLWAQGATNPELFRVTEGQPVDLSAPDQRTIGQEVGAGLARGVDQTQAMGAAGVGAIARASGLDSLSDWAQESFNKNMQEAAQNKATISDFGQANSAESWARFAIGAISEQAPQLAMDLGAAIAAGLTEGAAGAGYLVIRQGVKKALEEGAVRLMAKQAAQRGLKHGYVASSYVQNLGETDQAMLHEGVDNPLAAMGAAVPIAALDTVADAALLRTARRYAVGGDTVKMTEVLAEAGLNVGKEGGTEAAQEFLKNTAIMTQKTGFDPLSDAHLHEYANSAIIGAMVGGSATLAAGSLRVAADTLGKKLNGQNSTQTTATADPATAAAGQPAASQEASVDPLAAVADSVRGTAPVADAAMAADPAGVATPNAEQREAHLVALDQLLAGRVPEIVLPRSKVSALANGGYFDGVPVSFRQTGDAIAIRRGDPDKPAVETPVTLHPSIQSLVDGHTTSATLGAKTYKAMLQRGELDVEGLSVKPSANKEPGTGGVVTLVYNKPDAGQTAKTGPAPTAATAPEPATTVGDSAPIPFSVGNPEQAPAAAQPPEATDVPPATTATAPQESGTPVDIAEFSQDPGLSAPIDPFAALAEYIRQATPVTDMAAEPAAEPMQPAAEPMQPEQVLETAPPAQAQVQEAPQPHAPIPFSAGAAPAQASPAPDAQPAPVDSGSVVVDQFLSGRVPTLTMTQAEARNHIKSGVFSGQNVRFSSNADGSKITVRHGDARAPDAAPATHKAPTAELVHKATAMVASLRKEFGVNSEVEVSVDNGATAPAHVTFADGKAHIVLNMDMLTSLPDAAGMKASAEDVVSVAIAHEMGHVVAAELAHAMPEKVLQELRAVFEAKRKNLSKRHAYNKNSAAAGFDEFLADEFAAYLRGRQLGIKVETRRWFTRIRDKLAEVLQHISKVIFGEDRLSGTATGYRVMESIFRGYNGHEGATSKEQDYYDKLLANVYNQAAGAKVAERRSEVWERATGHKVKVSARRDISVAQLMTSSGNIASTVIGASTEIIKHPMQASRNLAAIASKVYHELPVLITADEELRDMGRGGEKIANSYKKQFQDTRYTHAVWRQRLQKIMKAMPEQAQKDFAMQGVIPQEITKYMNDFYEYVRPMLRTLGQFSNYIPHQYIQSEVTERQGEFASLIQSEAAKEGLVIGDDEALEIAQEVAAGKMGYDATDITQIDLHGPGLSASKARTLWFMTTQELLKNKFISNDLMQTIDHYTHSTLRRAHYERDMSGYSNAENIEEVLLDSGMDESTASIIGERQQRRTLYKYLKALTIPDLRANGNPRARLNGNDLARALVDHADPDFDTKNAWAINWALGRGYLKERSQKQNYGKPTYEKYMYYDRNKNLRAHVKAIDSANELTRDPNMSLADWRKKFSRDKARIAKILAAYSGTLGLDTLSPTARNYMTNVMAAENWMTMLFSSLSSLADLAGPVFRQRTMAGAVDAVHQMGKLLLTQKGRERMRLAEDFGYGERALSSQAFLELNGLQYQSAWAQKANNLLFKLNGQMALNHMTRTYGAIMAERFITRNLEDAKAGGAKGKRAERYLTELGLSRADAEHMNDPDYKHFSEHVAMGDHSPKGQRAMAKSKKIFDAIAKFSDSAISTPDASQRPVWGSDPRWMLVWHFKSFMYSYYHTLIRPTFAEAATRYREAGGNAAQRSASAALPVMLLAIPVLALAASGLWLRQLLQYRAFGQEAPASAMGAGEYLREIIKRGGLMGPWEMGYTVADSGLEGKSGLLQLLGPTVGHLDTILSFDAGRIAGRSVPVFSQVPAMREWAGSFFNSDGA